MKTMERVRKNFAKTRKVVREDIGLQAIFKSIFPISDFNGVCFLEFVRYNFGEPKYTVEECVERGMTYEVPIKITVRLVTYDVDPDTGVQNIRDIKEQEVYLGSVPLMTRDGVFVVNGTERVIVSQLQRSPGLFYSHDNGKTHASGKLLYSARIIPVRGSWIDLEFDVKDVLYVRIDRRRKFPVTTLLKALGLSSEELLRFFYKVEKIKVKRKKFKKIFDPEVLIGQRVLQDLLHPESKELLVKKNRKISKALAKRLVEANIGEIDVERDELLGKFLAHDLVDPATGEVFARCNDELTDTVLDSLLATKISSLDILFIDGVTVTDSFRKTLALDKVETTAEALLEIYRRLRPSSPPTPEVAVSFFNNLFFNPSTYDLSEVGRFKINAKLNIENDINTRTLTKEDIVEAVRYLVRLKDEQGKVDDIDHLGNRRVRTVGELVENQYRIGLVRMERAIRERMTLQEVETLMPHDLINPKPITSAIKEFFGTSQLSQFMDQTNPLSEVTHKRRLSALGPGGLSRERAGFEVRDVHPTHYGRICPVETPEGPNIGLIVSLAAYARVNQYGFIETPYRKIEDRKVTDEIVYMNALNEKKEIIAPAKVETDEQGRIVHETLIGREDGEVIITTADQVTHMDVAPNQLVSVATALIPFLENDDANRALMGSNMMRQAVPLLRTSAPLIGTGLEKVVAIDSGACLIAGGDGVVVEADANRLVLQYDEPGTDGFDTGVAVYRLSKYKKSNQNTCFTQKPLLLPGTRVAKGTVLADGPSCDQGELGLGKNVTVAFMTWRGYNFEDSILLSERLLKDDTYTSVHVEVFETMARDTKLGKEEITRDIPNVGEEALRNLDESGIVRIGAEVKPGDTLVGKVTPKGETMLSPEEKLLRAIFGDKAGDVKDSSLRVPPGVEGVVIDAKVFSRKGVDKDERSLAIEDFEVQRLEQDMEDELRCLKQSVRNGLADKLVGKVAKAALTGKAGKVLLDKGKKFTAEYFEEASFAALKDIDFSAWKKDEAELNMFFERYRQQAEQVRNRYEGIVSRHRKGDDLPPGVIRMVKIYVAVKRKLAVGDKMAGRHGNKGVVSRILPEEDMPFFADGTPVDIVLNPLGVPSRMNVGQVLEAHLGMAASRLGKQLQELGERRELAALREKLQSIYSEEEYLQLTDGLSDDELLDLARKYGVGVHIATPVFDGAAESEIRELLVLSDFDETGQVNLHDGLTGDAFDRAATVVNRSLFPGYPAAPWRQGAIRWTAAWRNGSLGHGGLWGGLYLERVSDR
jgi:DNA-directed RNA polymerase subunit beta